MTAQALPTEYPGLGQLYQMAPLMAFAQLGEQQKLAEENNFSLQQAFAGQQQEEADKRPLELEALRGRVAHQAAQTGLLGQQTEQTRLGNLYTGATQPGTISATNAKNAAGAVGSKADEMEQHGRVYGQLAARLKDEALTPWERVSLVKEAMGKDAERFPGLDKMLMDNHGNLADKFQKLSDDSYANGSTARKQDDLENMRIRMIEKKAEEDRKLAEIKAQAAIKAAGMKTSAKATTGETVDKHKARLNAILINPNSTEDERAEAAAGMNIYLNYDVTKATAAAGMADDRTRALIPSLGAARPATPQITPPVLPQRAPGRGVDGTPLAPNPVPERVRIIREEYEKATNPLDKQALAAELKKLGAAPTTAAAPALPAGMKDNGNGTFTLPDGRIVRRKAQ